MIASVEQQRLSILLQKLEKKLTVLIDFIVVPLDEGMGEEFLSCPPLLRVPYNAAVEDEVVQLL